MMSETASSSAHSNVSSVVGEAKCRVTDPNGILCGESESLGILKEFQRLYAERLRRLDGDSELAMHTLKSWVHDLTEQNTMLVQTVEELERELLKRVDLMHDQLRKTSSVIERNESLAKREKSEVEINLRHQVRLLQNDVSSLVDIISQAKEQGYCSGDNAKLHTVSQIVATPPKRSAPPMRTSDAVTESQSGIKDVDNLESQIAHKDAEIHSLLERIEEMQDIFSMTSKQIQQAVEAEHKSMKEIVANYEPEKVNLQTSDGKFAELNEALPSWVQERLKQQREQVNSLVSKLRELESSFIFVKAERDRLADDQKAPAGSHTEESKSVSHTSTDPSIIIASKELESTRQQLGEATKHVQSLASCVNDLEKKNRETQAALTVEVAEKHDQMLELRRELHQVEEQVKNANMQTHFKDNIIREMRNELKKYQAKISSESGSDLENKLKRGAFPTIPEVSSVSDSGVDDVDISSSTHSLQPEIDDLQLQLKDHLNQISEKDQELSAQRKALLSLEKEVAELRKTTSKATPAPQLPSITLRELEEYRLCTVEGQAAVEELRDEIEAIVTDLTTQEVKVADIERATSLYKEIIHNTQEILSQPSVNPVTALKALEEAQACIRDVHEKSEDFIRERQAGEQRRAPRERKVDKLQEQLDASHDNMRDAVENMEQALAERYEADRLSQQNFSDGSSYHSCKDSDSSNCLRQEMDRLEENNAELVSNLNGMERQKREAETKATQYFRELEKIRDQIARKSFTEELLHTKEQTICELQGALDSTRRQMRDLQSELERAARERDNVRMMLEQQSNTGPLQVAELQSELARLRNQMSTLNSKQALVDQYERRLKDSSDQAEKLSSQLNTLALNLQAKETMLSNKEEMIVILQDTLERTREELKLLKDKSGGASSSMDKPEQDEATANAGGVSDEVSGSSSVWGWTRNTATRKHRVHDV